MFYILKPQDATIQSLFYTLNKQVDGISNLLILMKLNFPIIGLSELKIGLNTPANNISLPGYAFCFDETRSTHGGTGFFINEKYLYTKRSDLNILLDKNLESSFIEINLPKKEFPLWLHL